MLSLRCFEKNVGHFFIFNILEYISFAKKHRDSVRLVICCKHSLIGISYMLNHSARAKCGLLLLTDYYYMLTY